MEKKKKMKNKKQYQYYLIILLIALLISIPLTGEGWIVAHDRHAHLSRNFATVQGLKEGQFPPTIASDFCGGFGYAWNLFYPPLSTYIGAFFRLIVQSYVSAMNLSIVLAIMVAGITMFQLMRKVTKNDKVGLITSIIYMSSTYFMTDIYIRMAMGEVIAYACFPLLFHGLYNIFYEKGKNHYLLTLGAVGVLLSHNISTLMAVALSVIFVAVNAKKLWDKECKKQIWKDIIINAIFIILLVLFFYVPFMQHKMATEYVAMQEGSMATKETVANHAISPYQLIFGKFQYGDSRALEEGTEKEMLFSLGLPIIIPLLFTPMVFPKIEKEKKLLYKAVFLTGIVASIMATTIFPWSHMPNIMIMMQFPWRMLLIATFTLSIIAGINISKCFENFKMETIVILTMIILMYIGQYLSSAILYDVEFDETYLSQENDVEEVLGGSKKCATFEYLPVKAKTEYTKNREKGVIVLSGDAKIKDEKKEKSNMQFSVEENQQGSHLELPYIYYLGYRVTFKGEKISYQESEHGFICIEIPEGETGEVKISYKGTLAGKISAGISVITGIVFIGYIAKRGKIKDEKKSKI